MTNKAKAITPPTLPRSMSVQSSPQRAAISNFLHGIEVIEVDDGYRSISTVASSVIGIVGTAPDADTTLFPLNTPILITRPSDFARLGEAGTLPIALRLIFAQYGAVISMVRVEAGADSAETMDNVIGDGSQTGIFALLQSSSAIGVWPRILLAPGFTHQRSTNGVMSVTVTDPGSGYTAAPTVTFAAPTDGNTATGRAHLGTGLNSDKVSHIEIIDPGSGYTAAPTVTLSDPDEGEAATATATTGSTRNRVLSNLVTVGDKLRAVILADGPNTTDSAAIQMNADFGSDRIFVLDPWVVFGGVTTPGSPVVAGLISRSDNERGFWWSPSNQEVNGIEGLGRFIDFTMGDPTSRANLLNANNIATLIQFQGIRLWGNRSLSGDQRHAFLSVRRTADIIADSIAQNHLWAVDKCINTVYLAEVCEGVKAFMRILQSQGAIVGQGDCWVDPQDNDPLQIMNGHIVFRYSWTAPYPAERITFKAYLSPDGLSSIFGA